MSENHEKNADQCVPKTDMMSTNVLICPQHKDIQFTVIEERRNHKIFTFKKLESENFDPFWHVYFIFLWLVLCSTFIGWSTANGFSSYLVMHVHKV